MDQNMLNIKNKSKISRLKSVGSGLIEIQRFKKTKDFFHKKTKNFLILIYFF
jgi:hypothetical protein